MKNNNNDNGQLNNLLKTLSKHLGSDPQKLKEAAQSGNINEIVKNLNSEDSKKIQQVLSDKNAVSKVLSSSQAQKLIKNFLGDK